MDFSVALLGLVQGLTEFLPVSSSGHLALVQIFVGMQMPPLSYDIVLHVATTCATIIFFWHDIISFFADWLHGFTSSEYKGSSGWTTGWAVIIATFITGLIGIIMKGFAEEAIQNSLMVGLGLTFTGFLLLVSRFIRRGLGKVRLTDGIAVGIAQGIAVLPGVSRSGMTMVAGMSAGLSKENAFEFSFLVSIPAIIGALILQLAEVGSARAFYAGLPHQWYFGAVIAFLSGLGSLTILKKIVIASKWWLFGIYCLILGLATVVISFIGV